MLLTLPHGSPSRFSPNCSIYRQRRSAVRQSVRLLQVVHLERQWQALHSQACHRCIRPASGQLYRKYAIVLIGYFTALILSKLLKKRKRPHHTATGLPQRHTVQPRRFLLHADHVIQARLGSREQISPYHYNLS